MKQSEKFCKEHSITKKQFNGEDKITGSLDLSSVTSIPEGFNPTVGGSLDLSSEKKYIGANVYVDVPVTNSFFWDGWAKIDGIFCQTDSEKKSTIRGIVYTIRQAKRIGKNDLFFIVSKDDFHSHGSNFKEAFEDLQFKIQSHKLKKEPISEDTEVTVAHYRAVTGACNMGCRQFMDQHNIKYHIVNDKVVEDQPMKAKDLLKILKKDGAYGVDRFEKLLKN